MTVFIVGLVVALGLAVTSAAQQQPGSFSLVPDEHGMVLKTPDGRTVLRYMTQKPTPSELTASSVCCLYPLQTPAGESTVDFAPSDHRHHRGVFLTWYSMDGKQPADFWNADESALTKNRVIVNQSIRLEAADARQARLAIHNHWTVENEVMIEEDLSIVAEETQDAHVVDLHFRLTPTGDVKLHQTAFGGLCIKARTDGQARYSDPQGEVKLPMPNCVKPETDWPAADWYDYTIDLKGGKTVGITVLDHPSNPPTVWHNVGVIGMVNPCINAAGPVVLKQGQPLRLRYRLVVHDGPVPTMLLNKLKES